MRQKPLILDGYARARLTVHCCQPSGLLLLMPGGVCVGGTFKQIQVAAHLSVQLEHCGVSCTWASRKWAGGGKISGKVDMLLCLQDTWG